MKVAARVNNVTFEPAHEGFGGRQEPVEGPLSGWLERVPDFESESAVLTSVLRQSVVDLAALRITGELLGESYVLPAAGLPWFMTLFGRDTLITSLQTLWVGPELARGALHLLGALQGTQVDDFSDEEPGRILHEVRSGELTRLGAEAAQPVLRDRRRDTALADPAVGVLALDRRRRVRSRALGQGRRARSTWIDRYGDRDGDGYVEYQTRSPQGLGNQCWKDSWDGVQFADGTIPHLPIATAEIQGYVYDAKLRVAELAGGSALTSSLAERLEREADELYGRFNEDFWSEDRGGYYVVGLDGDKQPIDSMTSNIGHLLWSGIVPGGARRPRRRPAHVGRDVLGLGRPHAVDRRSRLQPDRLPRRHDLAARQRDHRARARARTASATRRTGSRWRSSRRPPSPATGCRRRSRGSSARCSRFPVPYPTACSPQAWATGGAVPLRAGDARSRGP